MYVCTPQWDPQVPLRPEMWIYYYSYLLKQWCSFKFQIWGLGCILNGKADHSQSLLSRQAIFLKTLNHSYKGQ